MEPLIRNISDTARWVATYRADERERPDAVFHDPFARALAGTRGEQIAAAAPFMREAAWSVIARTYLIDQIVEREVRRGVDTASRRRKGRPSSSRTDGSRSTCDRS